MRKVFSYQSQPVTRKLTAYIEDWEKFLMKKDYQRNCTFFLDKYGRLSLYDIGFEKRYSIDDEDIHFVNGYGYYLIGNPEHPDGTSTDHDFSFHDDLFEIILETDQNSDIILKVIHKEASFSSINENSTDSRSKLRSRSEMVTSPHHLQRKKQKMFMIITRNRLMISS